MMFIRMYKQAVAFSLKYKIIRGMLSYAILWPVGSLMQQTLIEKRNLKTYDWLKCLRFSIYGGLMMGPAMYVWIRFTYMLWPGRDLRSSLAKAITEQFTCDPACIILFLFTMTLMEGRTLERARHEVSAKFFDTYKVGVVYWPLVQTINFSFIPTKNQVVYTSLFSMIWSSFLAYMKHLEIVSRKNKHGKHELVVQHP